MMSQTIQQMSELSVPAKWAQVKRWGEATYGDQMGPERVDLLKSRPFSDRSSLLWLFSSWSTSSRPIESRSTPNPSWTYPTRKTGLRTDTTTFFDLVKAALNERWTRDPFDRMITAQARFLDLPLLSKDVSIRAHYPRTIWN